MSTAREKADCASREVRQRQRVYPRWVADRRMTRDFADRQITIMSEIADDYRRIAERDESAGRLL